MTYRNEVEVTLAYPPAKVHAALANQGYWEYNTANLSTEPGTVHEFSGATPGEAQAVLYEVLPLDLLPEAVRAMISQALKVKRVYNVGALNDNATSCSYTADVKGTPVDFKGTIELVGDDSSTTLRYHNEITVAIPMMGAVIEPKVGDALGELFANEAKLTETWIAENL